jgi:hypothetical protein
LDGNDRRWMGGRARSQIRHWGVVDMVNGVGFAQSGYYLDDITDGMILVRRHGSGVVFVQQRAHDGWVRCLSCLRCPLASTL